MLVTPRWEAHASRFRCPCLISLFQEAVGLSMNRLQIRLFGQYFSSFLLYSYGYEAANELKSVLKHPNFRFGPYRPTGYQVTI
jgi:hypothetical protein